MIKIRRLIPVIIICIVLLLVGCQGSKSKQLASINTKQNQSEISSKEEEVSEELEKESESFDKIVDDYNNSKSNSVSQSKDFHTDVR